MRPREIHKALMLIAVLTLPSAESMAGQAASILSTPVVDSTWNTALPRGKTRLIDFVTDEGTEISTDISPDGKWVVFDLLGQVYRLSAHGGKADCLTEDSGIALNFHPVVSPDSRQVAFISDRRGQNGIWVMDMDGGNPRQIFMDPETRLAEPSWSPDGKSIVATRAFSTPGRGWHRQNTRLWQFFMDGRPARELVAGTMAQYNTPRFSPDGKYLYFHVSFFSGNRYGSQAGHSIQRLDLASGAIETVSHRAKPPIAEDFAVKNVSTLPPDVTAELAPFPSPDGRYLAYAREMPDQAMTYRGHSLKPRTALWLRDLETGEDRMLLDHVSKDLSATHAMYSYRVFPGYGWASDSASIVISEDGKIHRVDIKTGAITNIPFEARVKREISEQVRGHMAIEDDAFTAHFLQWPNAAPNGDIVVFTGAGRLWIVDKNTASNPRALAPTLPGIQITPSWSPDGKAIIFANWQDGKRGGLWIVNKDGSGLRQISTAAAEYIYPSWSPDGRTIIYAAHTATPKDWNGWHEYGGWAIWRMPSKGGKAQKVADLDAARQPYYGPGGRIFYHRQGDFEASQGLYQPYPDATALAQVIMLKSVKADGSDMRTHAIFPPARDAGSIPALSPDGKWIAYQSSRNIYVRPFDLSAKDPVHIDSNPNSPHPSVTEVGRQGGIYHRWRADGVLEFMSGDTYLTFNPNDLRQTETKITLTLPRHIGQGRLALTNARIITLDDKRVIEKGTVIIENSRIRCVGDCNTDNADKIMNLSGKTIIPGWFDAHSHSLNMQNWVVTPKQPDAAAQLAYGVTSIIDPATVSATAFPIAEMTEAGMITGPRTYSVGELIASSSPGLGEQINIQSLADAAQHVDVRYNWGARSLKNFRQARRDQTQKLVEAARFHPITVTGEGGPLFFTIGVIMDGQTGWEHQIPNLPIYKDAATFLGLANAVYSPTLSVNGHGKGAVEYFRPRHDFYKDAKYKLFQPWSAIAERLATVQPPIDTEFSYPILGEGLRDIIEAGGHGAIGEHGEQPGLGSHWEVWSYGKTLGAYEALKIASQGGAYFIGLEQELGSVSAGKIADLVILNANPLDNIENTLAIYAVMKAGRLYDGGTLNEMWPTERPYGLYPWVKN